jgi:transcription elongation factor
VGQKRKIFSGQYKGYEGVIRSVNDSGVRFELSAINKVVSVPFEALNLSKPSMP